MDETLDLNGRDAWIDHAAALRALARSLISDEHEAEDAVQETWLAYLRQGPLAIRDPRRWLAGVLRNNSIERLRRRTRRNAREEAVASDVHLPSGDEILERIELIKRVADHLAALGEPYRQALHLRYFEGLSAPEIARQTGEKLETVRTRLRRGRALMRERLDVDEQGDRQSWCRALSPIAGLGAPHLTVTSTASQLTAPLLGVFVMSQSTKLILVVAVLVLAGGSWMARTVSTQSDPPALAEPDTRNVAAAATGRDLNASTTNTGRQDATLASASPLTPESPPEVAQPVVEVLAPEVMFDGHVVLTDEEGRSHHAENGELFFYSENAQRGGWIKTPLIAGTFRCYVPSGARLRVKRLVARGKHALCSQTWVVDEATSGVEIQAQWTSAIFLRVVSKATGQDLDAITVKGRSQWRARIDELLPSESPHTNIVAEGALSPVALPDDDGLVLYWARAEGYAWGSIEVDHGSPGERRLELDPVSTLTVQVAGNLPRPTSEERDYVRLRRQVKGWHWDFAASRRVPAAGPTVFEGLPAGQYLVCYERGDEEGVRRGAQESIEVLLGQDMTILMEPDAALLDPPRAQLHGRLYLPDGVSRPERMTLKINPLDLNSGARPISLRVSKMEGLLDEPGCYVWDAGDVVPGGYVTYLTRLQHRDVIQAIVGSDAPVEIRVPPLASLSIEIVDAADASSLRRAKVSWYDGRLEGVSRNQGSGARRDARAKRWTILAPAGEIRININLEGYVEYDETVELTAGKNEVRVELRRANGLTLSLAHNGTRLRPGFDFWWDTRAVPVDGHDGRETWSGSSSRDATHKLLFDKAGEYELRFGELPGYAPIPPQRVEVLKGQVIEVEIEVDPR